MQGHERDRTLLWVIRVEISDERNAFEKRLHSGCAMQGVDFSGMFASARFSEPDATNGSEAIEVTAFDLLIVPVLLQPLLNVL